MCLLDEIFYRNKATIVITEDYFEDCSSLERIWWPIRYQGSRLERANLIYERISSSTHMSNLHKTYLDICEHSP